MPNACQGFTTPHKTRVHQLKHCVTQGAGTSAHVLLELFGAQEASPNCGSGVHCLEQGPYQPVPFGPGQTDAFEVSRSPLLCTIFLSWCLHPSVCSASSKGISAWTCSALQLHCPTFSAHTALSLSTALSCAVHSTPSHITPTGTNIFEALAMDSLHSPCVSRLLVHLGLLQLMRHNPLSGTHQQMTCQQVFSAVPLEKPSSSC